MLDLVAFDFLSALSKAFISRLIPHQFAFCLGKSAFRFPYPMILSLVLLKANCGQVEGLVDTFNWVPFLY